MPIGWDGPARGDGEEEGLVRTDLIRRVVSLFVACMMLSLVAAPAVSADVNVAPTVTAQMSNYNPDEWNADPTASSAVIASAAFTDAESASETYTCTIDYGDGTVVQGTISGMTCTGPEHQYKVTNTYAVSVMVTDSGGASGVGTSGASYSNRAPWVGGGLVGPFEVGSAVHDVAAIVDPGAAFETYTCTVDYGDGSPVQAGTYVPTGWIDGLPRCVGPDHIYAAPGAYSIVTTVTDSGGETGSSLVIETIGAVSPVIAMGTIDAGQPVEGQFMTAKVSFTDPDYDPSNPPEYGCTVDYGDGSAPQAGLVSDTTCEGQAHKYSGPGAYVVTITMSNSNGGQGSVSATISVANVAPAIVPIAGDSVLTSVGSAVTFSTVFDDPGTSETYTATWSWGDGSTSTLVLGPTGREVIGSHAYAKSGIFVIQLAISDGQASTSLTGPQVLVYNPASTLSGSGSVASSKGACRLSAKCSAASTASFSVDARYAKGATRPSVSLTYSAHAFALKAAAADWFVSGGPGSSWIQGTAEVNGAAGYTFRLVAIDGKPDALRLQVWSSSGALVYDNGAAVPLQSGSIKIK